MAVTAMTGTVGFAPQNAKTTDASYSAPSAWYKHKATLVDLAIQDETRLGIPEVGGIPIPTFPYKAGVLITGGMTIQPRLENTLGWLLYGALGDSSSAQQAATTVYDHTFIFNSSDSGFVPWFSFRKAVPRKDNVAATDLGEIYRDCKITGLTLTLPNDGPITARVDVIGRTFTLDEDPTAWTWTNASFEAFDSIPIGCQTGGYVKLPTFSSSAMPIQAATVSFQNVPLDIRQERVFGSNFIEDVTVVMRQVTFDMIVKWNNPDLYRAILTGATSGVNDWVATPYTSSLEILARSPGNIPTEAVPYSLKIECPRVMVQMSEGIQLAGNQAILLRVQGTALEPTSGEYTTFTLTNTATSYTPPAGDTTPPTVSTATVVTATPTTITLTFDENIQLESGSWMAGFSVDVNATPVAVLNAGRGAGSNTILLTIASAVTAGQTVTFSYDPAAGNVEDIAGNDLASITDQSVTNTVA